MRPLWVQAEEAAVGAELKVKCRGILKRAVKGLILLEPILCSKGEAVDIAVRFGRGNVFKVGKIEIKIL